MAVFKNAIALEHEGLLTGEFDVTFDCKPQRYLAIGEELVEIGAWGNTETAEGEIVTIDASSDTAVKALTVDIVPVQSGSGTPSPDNVRPISGWDDVGVSVVGKNLIDSSNLYQNGANRVDIGTQAFDYHTYLKAGTYTFSNNGVGIVYYRLQGTSDNNEIHNQNAQSGTFTITQDGYYAFWVYYWNGISVSDVTDVQLELGTTATTYEPYLGTTYTTTLPSTTYGGTLDVVSGTFKPAPYYASYNGEALEGEWISDRDKYVAGTTPTTGAQVVNIGKVGTTTQLTGQSVALLEGENNIFADSGNVTVEYGHNPTLLTNPTWFPSKPLLAVEGYGEIKFNNRSIVDIESGLIGDITLASDVNSTSVTINEDALNVGDAIHVRAERNFSVFLSDEYGMANRRTSDVITDSNSDFTTAFQSQSMTSYETDSDYYYKTEAAIDFVSGTTSTATDNVSGTITVTNKNNVSFTITFTVTIKIKYNATAHTIVETLSNMSVTVPPEYWWMIGSITRLGFVYKSIVGDSTVSRLGNPTYIDCDIGEAYMETGGTVVSLNEYIDLGSDLPTLPSGDTEVTYDNTITKVEVQPNWWKV